MWAKVKSLPLLLLLVKSICSAQDVEDHTTYEEEPSTEACGVMSRASGLIQGGELSARHDFPWMAVISTLSDRGVWLHKGSGSLVSRKHVVVKARSVSFLDTYRKWIPLSVERVRIYLGTTRHADASEEGALEVGVAAILNYPDARKVSSAFSIFNFAVITLERAVTFSDTIRPICLWSLDETLENALIDRSAYAVGYGVDESGRVSHTRKHMRVTIMSESACRHDYREEMEAGSASRFFCIAAIENERDSPCHFDSQLYVRVDGVWYLKGVLCSARMFMGFKVCVHSYPVLAEDITPYVEWIADKIK